MRNLLLFASLVTVSGCALAPHNERANSSLDRAALLSGYTKSQVLSCAGQPTSRQKTENGEVWQYNYAAYKDPEITPYPLDQNYSGISYVFFNQGTVERVSFAASPERTLLGREFSQKDAAALSLPVFKRC